jgi:hypothetical protein
MTIETLAIIIVFCLFCCYLVYRWQEAAMAPPPYQEPVKPDMVEQWVEVNKESLDKLEPTPLNPQAAWPFPQGPKP